MPELVGIGEILVEIMAQRVGQSFLEPGVFLGPYASGAPAICIDQAARLGASCGLISCVGNDDIGTLNIDRLARDGVDTTHILRKEDKTTGVAFVRYLEDGRRKFIFHFSDAAAGALAPSDIDPDMLAGVKILHIMGCSLSASVCMREAVLKAARIAKEMGAKVSFDPNLRPELLAVNEIRQAFSWIMENADILLTGADELCLLTGLDLESAIAEYRKGKDRMILVKSGSKGARLLWQAIDETIPSYTVQEVDPTGAGDCFDGAFLAMLLRGVHPGEAARVANAAGAFSVTKRGPMEGAAMAEDIKALMAK